jgi:ABC-type multidrug transport system fused ATPase/permease subunit
LIIYTLVYFINQKIEYYSKQKRNNTSGQLSFVTRSFNAMLSVVAFNRSYQEKKRFYKRTENIFQLGSKFILWDSINKALIYLMQYGVLLIVFIVFYIDSNTAIHNHTGGDLISFILLYVTILPVFGRIFKIETLWRLGLISLRKINHILSLPVTKRYEGEELTTKNPRLTIIDFSVKGSNAITYNSSKGGVRNLKLPSNLSAMDLFKCLLRINDDYSGAIIINQTSIKEFTAKSVRYNISIISTQFNFIGRTVFDAIATNKNLATIVKAKDLIHDIQIKFAITSPLLINDYIGENGNQLNPLQKEVLSIARTLMTDAKIIIVDTLPHLIKYNSTAYNEFWSQLDKSIVTISYESESQTN